MVKILKRVKQLWDAILPNHYRKGVNIGNILFSPDRQLTRTFRQIAGASVRECWQNSGVFNFALRKHLQFVASVTFSCNLKDDVLRDEVYRWYKYWSEHVDATRQCSLDELIVKAETARVIDGDVLVNYTPNGKIKLIESSFLRNPASFVEEQKKKEKERVTNDRDTGGSGGWEQGVKVNKWGRVQGYNIFINNKDYGLPADFNWLLSYTSFPNQYRGVSPFLPVVNRFIDETECIEYALKKAKISQLIGIVDKREFTEEIKDKQSVFTGTDINYFMRGLQDSLEFMTPSTPSSEFQSFLQKVITIALSAVDIPYGFFDSSVATYYGNKESYELYIATVKQKQKPLLRILNNILEYAMTSAVTDGDLVIGNTPLNQVLQSCQFSGVHYPMWQLFSEVAGIGKATELGFISKRHIADMFGLNYNEELQDKGQEPKSDNVMVNV